MSISTVSAIVVGCSGHCSMMVDRWSTVLGRTQQHGTTHTARGLGRRQSSLPPLNNNNRPCWLAHNEYESAGATRPAQVLPLQRQFPNQHRYTLVDSGANWAGGGTAAFENGPTELCTTCWTSAQSVYGKYALGCAAARHGRAWGIMAAATACSCKGSDDVCRDGC